MVDAFPDRVAYVLTVRQDAPEVRARLDQYRGLLSADERAREGRFYFDADKERFVIGRALVRLQLSRYLGGDPRQWSFVTNEHGRPELVAPGERAPLGFNVSHTRGMVACALAATHDVGVDVECVDRALTHDVAHRFFAPSEVSALHALPIAEQPRAFFDYWTLKEAYIKARGMGLAIPLGDFAFVLRPPAAPAITFVDGFDDDPGRWQFWQAWPTAHHRLGRAVERSGDDLEVRLRTLAAEALAP